MKKRSVKRMAIVMPKINTHQSKDQLIGWKRMKEIATMAMEKGNFNADDLREDLKNLRNTYK